MADLITIGPDIESQPLNDNFAALNGDISSINTNLGGWRIYNGVAELGLTPGTETMEDIAGAMPSRSMLFYIKDGANTSPAYPMTSGLLMVIKRSDIRVSFEFLGQSSGRPQKWFGYYASSLSPSFTGWAAAALEYETGTWTPDLKFGGSDTGITYNYRYGRYARVGRMVTIWFEMSLSNKGSATGNATVEGLPFVSNITSPSAYIVVITGYVTYPAGVSGIHAAILTNDTKLTLRVYGSGIGSITALTDSAFANNSAIRVMGAYYI